MKADAESLLVELLDASNALWAASRPFFSQYDITDAHFNVLNLLAYATSPVSQRELADQLLTDKSAVTGLIDRMEKKQLLRRTAAPDDRRVYHLQLTPKGRKLWQTVRPAYVKEVEKLFSIIPAAQRPALLDNLQRLKQAALARSAEK